MCSDYYAGGYRIGGDTLVLLSTDPSSRSGSETKRINIDVESHFGDCHEQPTTMSSSTKHSAVVCVSAYSTIEQALVLQAIQTGAPEFQAGNSRWQGIYQRARGLDDSIAKLLKEIGVRKGRLVAREQCAQLCECAVVIELLLVESLRQGRYLTIAL